VTSNALSEGMPWLRPLPQQARAMAQAHALLLHGATGDGLFEGAQAIARSWLCEAEDAAARPCGRCAACHLLQGGLHPDLFRLFPEALRQSLGGSAAEGGEAAESEGTTKAAKRKPSRQIRIDEVRAAIDWVATTSARGRAKVVLIYPAEAMNLQAASALLKTLEEPPRGARLLLAAAQPAQLLPTVRSRCQVLRLPPPAAEAARQWLAGQGLAQPEVLLAAASGRPLEAAALAAAGIDAARWQALPAAVLAGQAQAVAGWPAAQVLDALQKLCHDGLALALGAAPRFFPAAAFSVRPASAAALAAWSRGLNRLARQIEHPWSEPLLIDALLLQAREAWKGRSAEASDTLAA